MTAVAPGAAAGADVRVLQGAGQIGPAEWNSLARRGFHLHNWLVSAERCGWRARHVAIWRASKLLGVIPAYLTDRESLHDLHDRWLGPISSISAALGANIRPVISVQAPFAVMSEPLGSPDLLSSNLLHRVFDELEASADADGARAVAWPAVEPDAKLLLEVGRERGYHAMYAGASARITVEWDSFDHYVASRSKNVRRTIKADLGAIRSAGLRTELVSDFRGAIPAMTSLYYEAFRRRNSREAAVHPDFFAQLSRHPSVGIRAQLTWSGTQLVGSSLNLLTPHLLEGTFTAFSAEHRRGPAYYNDLCYEPIRVACQERIAGIDLGATALYTKVLRGAVLRRRVMLVRGTTLARHRLLGALGHLVARRTEWKERQALGPLWETPLRRGRTLT